MDSSSSIHGRASPDGGKDIEENRETRRQTTTGIARRGHRVHQVRSESEGQITGAMSNPPPVPQPYKSGRDRDVRRHSPSSVPQFWNRGRGRDQGRGWGSGRGRGESTYSSAPVKQDSPEPWTPVQQTRGPSFYDRVNQACKELQQLTHNEDDMFAACETVIKRYKSLWQKCQIPSAELNYLQDNLQKVFIKLLIPLLNNLEAEINQCRGRYYIFQIIGTLGSCSILHTRTEARTQLHRYTSKVLHQLVQSELSNLHFRTQFTDRRGIQEAINNLEKLLAPRNICDRSRYFNSVQLVDYRKQLALVSEFLKQPPARKKNRDPFVAAVIAGDLIEASHCIARGESNPCKQRLLEDLLHHDIQALIEIEKDIEFDANIHMLDSLCTFAEKYQHVFHCLPLVKKALKSLCTSIAKRVKAEIHGSNQKLSWPEELYGRLIQLGKSGVIDFSPDIKKHGEAPEQAEELNHLEIENDFSRVFDLLKPQGRKRTVDDLKKATPVALSLIEKEVQIKALPNGEYFKKSLQTIKTIYYVEYFEKVSKYLTSVFNKYGRKNYNAVICEMAQYRETYLQAKAFVGLLKDEQARHIWRLEACKVWGQLITGLKTAKQLELDCLEQLLELRSIAPRIPCYTTRQRFQYGVINLLELAVATTLSPELQNRLCELVEWIDQENLLLREHPSYSFSADYVKVTRRLKQQGKLCRVELQEVEELVQEATVQEETLQKETAQEKKPQGKVISAAADPLLESAKQEPGQPHKTGTLSESVVEVQELLPLPDSQHLMAATQISKSEPIQRLLQEPGSPIPLLSTMPTGAVYQQEPVTVVQPVTLIPVVPVVPVVYVDINLLFPILRGVGSSTIPVTELGKGFILLRQAREICTTVPHMPWCTPEDAKEKILEGIKLIIFMLQKFCMNQQASSNLEKLMLLPIINADKCITEGLDPLLSQHISRGELVMHWQLKCIQGELESLRQMLACPVCPVVYI